MGKRSRTGCSEGTAASRSGLSALQKNLPFLWIFNFFRHQEAQFLLIPGLSGGPPDGHLGHHPDVMGQ